MLVFRALFVFCFYYYVGVLLTICFLLSLIRWCFAHYLFSTLSITWVFCALIVFYFHFYAGVLRTICFLTFTITLVFFLLFLLLRWCFFSTFTFAFSTFTITLGFLRANRFLLLLLCWCFAHYLFSAFTITLVCCLPFVFYSR